MFNTGGSALRAGTGPLRRVAEDRPALTVGRRQGGDLIPPAFTDLEKVVYFI
jgi:hypothetical protein